MLGTFRFLQDTHIDLRDARNIPISPKHTLFDRLYVLRNQLLHGGATWQGSVNRSQVTKGAEIMAVLMPQFVKLMMDNPLSDWGKPYYPPATQSA